MTNAIDITPEHLAIVWQVFHQYITEDTQVWVFGSRVKATARLYSDLDLALAMPQEKKIPNKTMIALAYGFEESSLPYKVDILDINTISQSFKDIVDTQKIALPEIKTE
jgi:uncharacterized protein